MKIVILNHTVLVCYEAPVITSAEAISAEDIRLEWEVAIFFITTNIKK